MDDLSFLHCRWAKTSPLGMHRSRFKPEVLLATDRRANNLATPNVTNLDVAGVATARSNILMATANSLATPHPKWDKSGCCRVATARSNILMATANSLATPHPKRNKSWCCRRGNSAEQHPDSSLGRYVFGSEISYNKAPPRLPGLGC